MGAYRFYLLFLLTLLIAVNNVGGQSVSPGLVTDSVYSEFLQENRTFCIYFPPCYDAEQTYRIVFAADGQMIRSENYATRLDSLILSGQIQPFILVGVDHYEAPDKADASQYRLIEYTENKEPRHENHYLFFTREMLDVVKNRYNLRFDEENLFFYGCSNGANFGLIVFLRDRPLFKNYILFSVAGRDYSDQIPTDDPEENRNHHLFISWGSDELFLIKENCEKLAETLKNGGYDVKSKPYAGGHDRRLWVDELMNALIYYMN